MGRTRWPSNLGGQRPATLSTPSCLIPVLSAQTPEGAVGSRSSSSRRDLLHARMPGISGRLPVARALPWHCDSAGTPHGPATGLQGCPHPPGEALARELGEPPQPVDEVLLCCPSQEEPTSPEPGCELPHTGPDSQTRTRRGHVRTAGRRALSVVHTEATRGPGPPRTKHSAGGF